jgi:C-terminal processing protease CtpA/Prc
MRHTLILISILTFAIFSNAQAPSKKAKKYIDKVLTTIENNYFYIDSINIGLLKEKCYALISNAKTAKDTYPAIDTLLKNLFDHHHIFLKPEQFNKITYFEPLVFPSVELLDKSIGYIKIPSIIGH